MSTFSGQKNSGMEIPDYAIERIARCLLPMIQAYYESDEGQAELAAWIISGAGEESRSSSRGKFLLIAGLRSKRNGIVSSGTVP